TRFPQGSTSHFQPAGIKVTELYSSITAGPRKIEPVGKASRLRTGARTGRAPKKTRDSPDGASAGNASFFKACFANFPTVFEREILGLSVIPLALILSDTISVGLVESA